MTRQSVRPYCTRPYDEEIVVAAVAGERPYLNPANRGEAIRRLTAQGYVADAIAKRIGCCTSTVSKARSRVSEGPRVVQEPVPKPVKPPKVSAPATPRTPRVREEGRGAEFNLAASRELVRQVAYRLARCDEVKRPAQYRDLLVELAAAKASVAMQLGGPDAHPNG